MSIYLTAIIKSKPGSSEALKVLLLDLVTHSRKEAACIQYDLHQTSADPNTFIFHEEWESQEGLDKHNEQEHIHNFIEKSAAFAQGPTLIYQTEKLA